VIQHGGGIEGFNTFLAYYPDSTVTVRRARKPQRPGTEPRSRPIWGSWTHGGVVRLTSERKEIARAGRPRCRSTVGTYEIAPVSTC
jgi:hypothetical protein